MSKKDFKQKRWYKPFMSFLLEGLWAMLLIWFWYVGVILITSMISLLFKVSFDATFQVIIGMILMIIATYTYVVTRKIGEPKWFVLLFAYIGPMAEALLGISLIVNILKS